MASGALAEGWTCLLCNDPHKEHVVVECGHSFCQGCMEKAWECQGSFMCPDCKKEIKKRRSSTNQAMGNSMDSSLDATTLNNANHEEDGEPITGCSEHEEPITGCSEHEEPFKFYCEDDKSLICLICKYALKHRGHTFLPVEDVVRRYQAELSESVVLPMEEALKNAQELVDQQSEKIDKCKNSISEARQHIVSEFESLSNSLKDQKKKLLQKLRKQNLSVLEDMEANAARIEKERDDLREEYAEACERLHETHPISFLTDIKQVMQMYKEWNGPILNEQTRTVKQLCPATFKGPLQYTAWRQLQLLVGQGPEEFQQPEPVESKEPEDSADPLDQTDMECEAPSVNIEEAEGPGKSSLVFPPIASETNIIWILGDPFFHEVYKNALMESKRPLETSLKNWTVCLGKKVPQWHDLFFILKLSFLEYGKPDIILLHIGSNDVNGIDYEKIEKIKSDLSYSAELFPGTEFLLSTVLPIKPWIGNTLEDCRKGLNSILAEFAERDRFQVVSHDRLESAIIQRFESEEDGRLSSSELAMFLDDIRNSLVKATLKVYKAKTERDKLQLNTVTSGDHISENAQGTSMGPSSGEAMQPSVTQYNSSGGKAPPENSLLQLPISEQTKIIWMVGDTYLANIYAFTCNYSNLGFDQYNWAVHWLPTTLKWNELALKLNTNLQRSPAPDIILIHLGYLELLRQKLRSKLFKFVSKDLNDCFDLFPATEIIVSTVLPRKEWLGNELEDLRLNFNAMLCKASGQKRYHVVQHQVLENVLIERMKTSKKGQLFPSDKNMLLVDFKMALLKVMAKISKKNAARYRTPKPGTTGDHMRVHAQGSSGPGVTEQIWIVGNLYISLACRHALASPYGQDLGFEEQNWTVHWLDKVMHWHQVVSFIKSKANLLGVPAAVLLHIGFDYEDFRHLKKKVNLVKKCLTALTQLHPMTTYVWSATLPEAHWMKEDHEDQRMKFNASVGSCAKMLGCAVARHRELESSIKEQLAEDGRINLLSQTQTELFVTAIRDSLLEAMKMRAAKLEAERVRKEQNIVKESEPVLECDQPDVSLATPEQSSRQQKTIKLILRR